MLTPVEVNSLYNHLSVVRHPNNAKYVFDSNKERTYRIRKVIQQDTIYYAKVTADFYLPIADIPRAKDRWYFVQ